MIPRRKAYLYLGELTEIAKWFRTGGKENTGLINAWEEAIAQYVGMPYAAAVNSGRRAMTLILKYLGIGPHDEVIISAYTLKDLIPLIQDMGARVIPADIDPETLNICPQAVSRRITRHTKAILVLHAFGSPCAIEDILALARQHSIAVIEDCAHSLGATVLNRQTGSFGYASFFSFETTKPVNTFGGGMVVSQDKKLIESIQMNTAEDHLDLRAFKKKVRATRIEQTLFSTGLGYPLLYLLASGRWKKAMSRLYRKFQHAPPVDIRYLPIQADMGLKKLVSLAERIRQRNEASHLLQFLLRPQIRLQRILDGCASTRYFFVAVLPCEAGMVRRKLLLRGIDAGIEDEIADNCATLLGFADCPNTRNVYSRAISLPMYDGISQKEIHKLCRVLNEII